MHARMTNPLKTLCAAALLSLFAVTTQVYAEESLRAPKMTKSEAEAYLDDEGIEANTENMPGVLLNAKVETVVAMLTMGVDPNAKSKSLPQTFLELASMACATKKGDTASIVQIVDALLEFGADPNKEGMQGLGAMLTAAQQCPGVVMERLVKGKGDINTKSYQGFTPLSMALIVKNYDAAETLIRLGARLKPESGKKILDGQESDARLKELIKRATSK